MALKSDTLNHYWSYEAWLKTQHDTKLKCLQTDQGSKYLLKEFSEHLKSQGTVHSLTVHDTPEENGVVERLNCTLLEHARAMHYAADFPKFLWTESLQHATWLKNRTSMHTLDGRTPYEMLHGSKLDLKGLLEWGAQAFVLKQDARKLDAKADEGHWVGYSNESQGHRTYWPGQRCITVERNVTFNRGGIVIRRSRGIISCRPPSTLHGAQTTPQLLCQTPLGLPNPRLHLHTPKQATPVVLGSNSGNNVNGR
jgi:hypothetical protein